MDTLIGILILVGIGVLMALPKYLRDKAQLDRQMRRSAREMRKLSQDLVVRCHRDTLTTDEGVEIEVVKVSASGSVIVPFDNCPCRLSVRVLDVTDQKQDEVPMPVVSLIPDLCDESGFIKIAQEITVPYRISTFSDLPVALLIPDAMVLPRRGHRKLRVCVRIQPAAGARPSVDRGSTQEQWLEWAVPLSAKAMGGKEGSALLDHHQEAYGYLETRQRQLDVYKLVAKLALGVCAADGRIDKREAGVVRQFFEERLAGIDDREEHKKALNRALREAQVEAKGGAIDQGAVCGQIAELHGPQVAQEAYELCVQIVAADERVASEENAMLRRVAAALNIPDTLAHELRDRFLALSMFEDRSPEALLGMPAGLPREEQIAFLNREYQKWRSRVTHKDATIRAEAEMRLKLVTKLRRRIDDAELLRASTPS